VNKKRGRFSRVLLAGEIVILGVLVFLIFRAVRNYESVPAASAAGSQAVRSAELTASQSTGSAASEPAESAASRPAESAAVQPAESAASSQETVLQPVSEAASVSSPETLTDVNALPAGTVLAENQIDSNHLESYFISNEIAEGDAVYQRINQKSYRKNDNIGLSDLRYLKVIFRDFNNQIQVGEIIVNAKLSDDFLSIFQELYQKDYQIRQMHLVDNYWTGEGESTDTASIEDDNTSAFNYRTATGSSNLSNHAYGCAIDLNPLENPYVVFRDDGSGKVYHAASEAYIYNRSSDTPHVITHDDFAFQLFQQHGFSWGGDWNNPKDYQHFEKKVS
jgi:hypothetical protein